MWPRHYSFLSIIILKRIGELLLTEIISRLAAAVQLGSPGRTARRGVGVASALLVLEHNNIKNIGVRGNGILQPPPSSLVSLEGAPGGRSSTALLVLQHNNIKQDRRPS